MSAEAIDNRKPRKNTVNARIALRTISTILICAGVLVYVGAKIDFFKHYGEAGYLREHSIYWILIAAIAFLLLLIERFFPEEPSR
jgi:hypothetical protein